MKNSGDGPAFILQTYEDRLNNNNNNNNKSSEIEKLSSPPVAKLNKLNGAISGPAPPPPPPLPQLNGNSSSLHLQSSPASVMQQSSKNTVNNKPKPPTVPVKYSVLSYNNNNNRAKSPASISSSSSSTTTTFNEYSTPQNPPPCPSPDYDSLSLASSTTSSAILSSKPNDSAEMESLDSYQMTNPSNVTPKPPSTYFKKRTLTNSLSNQSVTTTRTRPVSITIGEYPSMRRQPGKLDFLRNMNDNNFGTEKKSSTIGNQLTNELIQTLNRSNLRKKTESMEDLLSANYSLARIKTQRNGSVQISLNKNNLAKSTNDLTADDALSSADDNNYDTLQRKNRVTINVNSNLQIVENNNSSPSGILKNGHECNHKIISAQKSITFGEMPTLTKPKMSFKT